MATKTAPNPKAKKPDDKKKLLITAIKKTINANTVLPILENVYFDGKSAIVTDLETSVILPYQTDVNACVPARKVVDILEMIENPVFTADKNFAVNVEEGKRKIKVTGENPENFPLIPLYNTAKENSVGIGKFDKMDYLEEAMCFVSKDELRPAMTGVYFEAAGKKYGMIVATDAHRLFYKKISPLSESFILPKKSAKVLLAFGGEWTITSNKENYIAFTREDGLKVVSRVIDVKFPDYKVVVPKDEPNVKMFAAPDILLRELKNASKFANRSTNQVTFHLNGVCTLSSQDVDFGEEYKSEVSAVEFGFHPDFDPGYLYEGKPIEIKEDLGVIVKIRNLGDFQDTEIMKDALTKAPKELMIAFNGVFLQEILHKLPKDEAAEFHFWSSTKATVINGCYLVMPLMLNQ